MTRWPCAIGGVGVVGEGVGAAGAGVGVSGAGVGAGGAGVGVPGAGAGVGVPPEHSQYVAGQLGGE